ncbi:urease accessory protein UreF [Brunnivagina elsteri]|uniref:Urease accessory protein UreF n=1 Tax=Brunnivagina elsteri CCALA 953 TaxID=987040 RepID=A0A2A2TPH0_9CYAN|nr:urease accessory protein UreF [Calothrix elsteri]PAX60332.1 urease accessory protein UreF [Calothrix elsteri CCALA 953]
MDTNITLTNSNFLWLLQLVNSTLPVGAYSYSEGLETLIDNGVISSDIQLQQWLVAELRYGAIRLEAAVIVRVYAAIQNHDFAALSDWNLWLSALRETEELRSSSLQMGRSLMQLLVKLQPDIQFIFNHIHGACNYAVAFGIALAFAEINPQAGLLGYLQSWASNLIIAGVKLIPLGQTAGQKLLFTLQPFFSRAVEEIITLEDDDLSCCSWGLSLASMQHEVLYTRLFRS